jgi:transcriptional regulator with PAS, ATPase and Fis domain
VLILGETGTGKEVVAREIHRLATPNRPFVALNCAAIPAELYESRLFGSERGAYTGAERTLPGAFEVAADGVLFLDEITEIEPALQAKLLRVLEEREFERIGSSRRIRFRGRVLASSNRDAREGVRSGSLRQDLYYRLSTYVIRVPPLRERREDIPALAAYFLERKSAELKRTKPDLTDEQVRALCALDWPGNVRELENAIESFIVSGRLAVSSAMLREETGEDDPDVYALPYGQAKEALLRRFQRKYIASVLSASGGDVHAAAARMGLTRFGLQKLMRHLGMAPSERAGS